MLVCVTLLLLLLPVTDCNPFHVGYVIGHEMSSGNCCKISKVTRRHYKNVVKDHFNRSFFFFFGAVVKGPSPVHVRPYWELAPYS